MSVTQIRISLFVGCLLTMSSTSLATNTERHVNLVALQADDVSAFKAANFDSIITGNLGALITSFEKQTHVMFSTRTAGLLDRDVINVQTDVLRLASDNTLANGGFNCRLIFDDESDEDSAFYSISGICDQLVASASGTTKKQTIIKRTMLSDPSEAFNVWSKLYEDKETGLIFYVDID
ncbi:MAG: hypothetical protein AUK35_07870 [Zetaproteobacteria bacterium CG2_30_46_52]|nr:MAG: hypothetical protein AUK35_07870 [Zetaproteobacteria bacterium CG2_30_46_52]